jgi:hypothetical protein
MNKTTLARNNGDSYAFLPMGGGVTVVFQSSETVGTYHLAYDKAQAFMHGLIQHERFEIVPNQPLVG